MVKWVFIFIVDQSASVPKKWKKNEIKASKRDEHYELSLARGLAGQRRTAVVAVSKENKRARQRILWRKPS